MFRWHRNSNIRWSGGLAAHRDRYDVIIDISKVRRGVEDAWLARHVQSGAILCASTLDDCKRACEADAVALSLRGL